MRKLLNLFGRLTLISLGVVCLFFFYGSMWFYGDYLPHIGPRFISIPVKIFLCVMSMGIIGALGMYVFFAALMPGDTKEWLKKYFEKPPRKSKGVDIKEKFPL